jgi:hypothetical protein
MKGKVLDLAREAGFIVVPTEAYYNEMMALWEKDDKGGAGSWVQQDWGYAAAAERLVIGLMEMAKNLIAQTAHRALLGAFDFEKRPKVKIQVGTLRLSTAHAEPAGTYVTQFGVIGANEVAAVIGQAIVNIEVDDLRLGTHLDDTDLVWVVFSFDRFEGVIPNLALMSEIEKAKFSIRRLKDHSYGARPSASGADVVVMRDPFFHLGKGAVDSQMSAPAADQKYRPIGCDVSS